MSRNEAAATASHVVTATVPHLPPPPAALFEAAAAAALTKAEHDRLALDLPAFNALEIHHAAMTEPAEGPVRIAAWNAERLKHHTPSVELVASVAPDVLLLSEADLGMARAGNRHTVADLAEALGFSYAYGVEFLELGLGDERERAWHRGETNAVGFHGNALLSRLPLSDVALIRLDDGAVWWLEAKDDQRRLGFRMAIAARIETSEGPLLAVVVHLESKSDADDRARQIARLIETINGLAGDLPVVIGGDLNTKDVPFDGAEAIADAAAHEPLFGLMAEAGFDWRACNAPEPTLRTLPDGKPLPPFRKIDWLFTRGLVASNPATIPAVDDAGAAISDHELIMVDVVIG
ncbi:endonuclease/exonuclease/phosphatase family protein [Kaistia dalseonensis]|uniref:Endonuclease/exonuclease/phosphatase family metal-dependent hydrolase n=1 Tax=Kaistia dalseonensis TaxID=410840 RepID=A0ABU0HDE4_9HYPH|nr:endonuclease/exonuclease/phosphatase family protein [Kaistia dalseonensis]MCX5497683.1 endonuclease/exonuclease/phosphatase family protein [Kaistia dalseonensis]MDQ0440327.1 endonuclease/exonuclease/phosphatase family metal-dependent hydrolase [Kaistia dalseonensis]